MKPSPAPLRINTLRDQVGLRHQTVSDTIADLIHRGVIELTDLGYRLVDQRWPADEPVPDSRAS